MKNETATKHESILEVFVSDVHFPHEDKAAWQLVKQVVADLKPDRLVLGGDIADFYSVSRHDKDPRRKLDLQHDLDYQFNELQAVRNMIPDARIDYIEGNHENRLTRYLSSRAEELSCLKALHIPELMRLSELDIHYRGADSDTLQIGKLYHIHGHEVAGGGVNVARSKLLKSGNNVIFGHHHRVQFASSRNLRRQEIGSWANGCLCDLYPDYLPVNDWVLGFSIIEYSKSGYFAVEQVIVTKVARNTATARVRGKLYEVRLRGRGAGTMTHEVLAA